jgi:hypothetical protein
MANHRGASQQKHRPPASAAMPDAYMRAAEMRSPDAAKQSLSDRRRRSCGIHINKCDFHACVPGAATAETNFICRLPPALDNHFAHPGKHFIFHRHFSA